ncbi:hypothetical protein [Propionimicrobium lymphophilum]|nr:hypothetical protein [Propionimicrobium lymphophilum]
MVNHDGPRRKHHIGLARPIPDSRNGKLSEDRHAKNTAITRKLVIVDRSPQVKFREVINVERNPILETPVTTVDPKKVLSDRFERLFAKEFGLSAH